MGEGVREVHVGGVCARVHAVDREVRRHVQLDHGVSATRPGEPRASLAAMDTNHERSFSGSRRLPSRRQAMAQAAAVASSARSRSPVTMNATRAIASWWAATIRVNATSSPAAARSTSVAAGPRSSSPMMVAMTR